VWRNRKIAESSARLTHRAADFGRMAARVEAIIFEQETEASSLIPSMISLSLFDRTKERPSVTVRKINAGKKLFFRIAILVVNPNGPI
jgi:hypothetical protein